MAAHAHVLVALPKHGPGAHDANNGVAVDGRGRAVLASRGPAGGTEAKKGSFFWAVGRASVPMEANVVYTGVPWGQSMVLGMPKLVSQRKRHKTEFSRQTQDLPHIALVLNDKPIAKHTQLLVLLPTKA